MSCSGLLLFLNIETDVISGDSAERCPSCKRRGSKTQDQDEDLSEVWRCSFLASDWTVQNFILFNFFFVACCLMSFGAKVLVLDDAAFAAWMCCYRARELRWSPWSQTWASVRRRWSSSPSTASPSRSKFRIWTPPSLQRLVSWLRCCQQCFYCFFLFILKRVRQSERNAEVFERPQREAEARSALLKQQGSFVFPPLMKSFMSVKPPHLSLIVSLKRHF